MGTILTDTANGRILFFTKFRSRKIFELLTACMIDQLVLQPSQIKLGETNSLNCTECPKQLGSSISKKLIIIIVVQ